MSQIVQLNIELHPFEVPDGVAIKLPSGRPEDDMRLSPVVLLADVPTETLEKLIEQFRQAVLLKAETQRRQG